MSEQDGKRDLKADMELCKAASPGPWQYLPPSAVGGEAIVPANGPRICDLRLEDVRDLNLRSEQELTANARFIAAAREGWPHAIRRAMEAEERVRELEAQAAAYRRELEKFADVCVDDSLSDRAERAREVRKVLAGADTGRTLSERVKALEKVAEAASEYREAALAVDNSPQGHAGFKAWWQRYSAARDRFFTAVKGFEEAEK